jgi:hypothetical protein
MPINETVLRSLRMAGTVGLVVMLYNSKEYFAAKETPPAPFLISMGIALAIMVGAQLGLRKFRKGR